MCAINPAHKKRLILDVYTSNTKVTKDEFDAFVRKIAVEIEQQLNASPKLRWHIKETEQEAE